jgi:hypothetical protein
MEASKMNSRIAQKKTNIFTEILCLSNSLLEIQVSENIEDAKKLMTLIKKLIREYYDKELDEEYKLYNDEPYSSRVKRAQNMNEWVSVPIKYITSDTLRMCDSVSNGNDCWYQGNLDRMNEFKLFRLKGGYAMYCDVCMDNDKIIIGTDY